ncbi:DNA-3-methyladenine glycosylase I [Breznakiella homolactica]|uniref:DNA-3-methyladenine glycosylase I n=1 Tax=Breznakiella homolactica TaxID=2798577 RepID=A0A7T7XPK9_9SPIR|nr:DNA-3-methyladenine glycosylase I [Breznakiella homolactica]QQO10186.1 DNA-3-methyladenine glycosylase I [Breznakiella homolactica]
MELIRCPWCGTDPDYIKYHDREWGNPLKNNKKLFELLILEGAQAGLSWITILKRREGYRRAFDGMDPEKIARYTEKDVARLMEDSGIIRNRRKIQSAIENARVYLTMMEGPGSFSKWLWNWVDGVPIINRYKTMEEIPASTELSERISRELKKKGFSFVGPTIIYAYMQSAGLVNDHLTDCHRHPDFSEA